MKNGMKKLQANKIGHISSSKRSAYKPVTIDNAKIANAGASESINAGCACSASTVGGATSQARSSRVATMTKPKQPIHAVSIQLPS